MAGGTTDFVFGITMTLGTGGLAVAPGVGLMTIGIDQVYSGEEGIRTGTTSPSVVEFAGFAAAKGLGFGDGTAQMVGAFTPAALSIIFTFGGGLLTFGGIGGEGGGDRGRRDDPPDADGRGRGAEAGGTRSAGWRNSGHGN